MKKKTNQEIRDKRDELLVKLGRETNAIEINSLQNCIFMLNSFLKEEGYTDQNKLHHVLDLPSELLAWIEGRESEKEIITATAGRKRTDYIS